jgi:hypothetical protein
VTPGADVRCGGEASGRLANDEAMRSKWYKADVQDCRRNEAELWMCVNTKKTRRWPE